MIEFIHKIKMDDKLFVDKLKKYLNDGNISIIVFGETHGFLDDSKLQKIILNYFRPSLILYEMLEETSLLSPQEKTKFLEEDNKKDFSVISTFGELKKTISLAKEFELPIKGCDLKNMCRENKDFLSKTELNPEEEKLEKKIIDKRERKQIRIIQKSFEKYKKIFVSLGAYHLRENAPIYKLLKEIEGLIIYPSYKGEQSFGPEEGMTLSEVSFEIKKLSGKNESIES